MSSQEQITLLFELEEELREGRSPTEIRDLLMRLKRRDDLLAKIATKIDAALKSLEDKTSVQARGNVAIDSIPSSEPIIPPNGHPDRGAVDYPPAAESGLCPQCRAQVEAGSKFCRTCGTALGEPGGATVPAPIAVIPPKENVQEVAGGKSCRYICTPDDVPQLIADVKGWLNAQGFDSQHMSTEKHSLLLQIKKRGGWRDVLGMATSLNILFRHSADTLTVEIGAGKWADKATAGTVGMFLIPGLAITAGFGAWEQMKMPERIFAYIGTRLSYR